MTATRKIQLTRVHAINWYGYHDTIPVEGHLLLAGVTGSGKSILMDLLQLVLVGSERALFNRSATGTTSDRTLKGYCLADTKREQDGQPQYLRKDAISYVALEFTWPDGARVETWGLRIEFRNTTENQGRIAPFFCQGALAKADFLDADRRPLLLPAFRHLVEKEREGQIFDSQEHYLRDMAATLNFSRGVLSTLLPTAMSFTNLKSFDEFCRRFILPGDRLNVSDVVASYRSFQAYEHDLRELREQLGRLQTIRRSWERHADAVRDRGVARYLAGELGYAHAAARASEEEAALETLRTAHAAERLRIAELEGLIAGHRGEIKALEAVINQTEEGRLFSFIKERNRALVGEIAQLSAIGTRLEDALRARMKNARHWLTELRSLPLAKPLDTAELNTAIERLDHAAPEASEAPLAALNEAMENAKAAVSRAVRPARERLETVRRDLGQRRDEARMLEAGQLPFPTRLLNALNDVLPRAGRELPAQPLCKLCEVEDEKWRAAIEVAFTRKFAVVVTAEHYPRALAIYHELRGEAERESLVHPTKALRMARDIRPGSLAEKLRSEHPVARAVISQLFGDLICKDRREDLDGDEPAILPDGFMSRGAFVERRRHYDGMPFVGLRGLEQQLVVRRSQIREGEAEERRLGWLEEVDRVLAHTRELFPPHTSLAADRIQARELPKRQSELAANIDKLNAIDRDAFEQHEEKLRTFNKELETWEKEWREKLQSQAAGEIARRERALATFREDADLALKAFEQIKRDIDISAHLTRCEEWKAETLAKYPVLEVAARHFKEAESDAKATEGTARAELVGERRLLASAFPRKFDDLPAEAHSNEPYDKLLAQIAEARIPDYEQKAKDERGRWEQLFRTQILAKMHHALREVGNVIVLLNGYLKSPIGSDRYEIEKRPNPDFKRYHQLLELNAIHQQDDLFFASVDGELRASLDHFLSTLVNEPDSAEAARLLDYRHYFDYRLWVHDITRPGEAPVDVDKQSGKMSGGENQSPYFVAILASYLRAYKRHETRWRDPSLALVPIDEAFSKMDPARIQDCIRAINALDLQGVFSMSAGNIPAAFAHCDQLLTVSLHKDGSGGKLRWRNVVVNLFRDSPEGRELLDRYG